MVKKKVYLFSGGVAFVLLVFAFSILYSKIPSITGFTFYESQPDATSGFDTYIRGDFPNNNFGTATQMQVGKTVASLNLRALIKFNLSEIPDENTILSSNISFYVYSLSGNNLTLTAYLVTSNWTETEATWNKYDSSNEWTTAGGDYITELDSVFVNQTGTYNLSITTAVRAWKNSSYENYGLVILSNDAVAGSYIQIYSSDYSANPLLRPKIFVEHTTNAVPEIENISTDSSPESPKQVEEDVTFTIDWLDLENDDVKAFVCNSSDITSSGCQDKTFCNVSLSSANPLICSYTTQDSNNRTTEYFAKVCDASNCSETASSFFYVNHMPEILLIQPNGGEVINQSQGNYQIRFNVSDKDGDELISSLYYSENQNETTSLIASNLNLTDYCTDIDSTTTTTNNCSYSWNSSGVYGEYYLTIILNDSYTNVLDSSDSSFSVVSIIDSEPPEISSITIESEIWSGKSTYINATINDENSFTTWVDLNYTSANLTMSNLSDNYYATFYAPAPGVYQFKIYARDIVGNLGSSSWYEFNVSKPNAAAQNIITPSIALPYHTLKVTGNLSTINSLKNVYAYLNSHSDFTFLSDYPQNKFVGNLSQEEVVLTEWFLSAPLEEGTYSLNVTYTDGYGNQWQSNNSEIVVTSAIGGYDVSVSGYPEVETSQNYYAESYFKQNGVFASPDSMTILIYDSTDSLIVGPASMTGVSTGKYNYTYTVGASASEGQWKTIVNATKSSVSYYAYKFWKVIGGPFDVRSITILDAETPLLNISVVAENTGGANKDLTLVWNLTRTDTNELLDSGSETFMVPANSEKAWYVQPETNYVGNVKIVFLGWYSGTEKAGAFRTFSTTEYQTPAPPTPSAPSGGGASASPGLITEKKADFDVEIDTEIYLTKSIDKEVVFKINNIGEINLDNFQFELQNLDNKYYEFIPLQIEQIKVGESVFVVVKFRIEELDGERDLALIVKTNQKTKAIPLKINIVSMKEYFLKEIERLEKAIENLKGEIAKELLDDLTECESLLNSLKGNVLKEEYIVARENIKRTDDCINKVKQKPLPERKIKLEEYWVWIITWGLILVLIIVLIIIIYILNRKLGLVEFLRRKKDFDYKNSRGQIIDKKIQSLKDKLNE